MYKNLRMVLPVLGTLAVQAGFLGALYLILNFSSIVLSPSIIVFIPVVFSILLYPLFRHAFVEGATRTMTFWRWALLNLVLGIAIISLISLVF